MWVPMVITGTFVDITERKKEEMHLRVANRKMLTLSQITRHDITNQLNNMSISFELLYDVLSDDGSDVHIKKLFELVHRQIYM